MLKNTSEQQILSDSFFSIRKNNNSNKLNLFGKGIDIIDKVISKQATMENIRQIDLSHNVISTITNAEQFKNVQLINLSHNRIEEAEEIFKLHSLPKLHSLLIKGNPFLNKNIPSCVLSFLLSIETDIDLVDEDIQYKIEEITFVKMQVEFFLHYLKKIDLHIQFANSFYLEETFANTQTSMFPKIKKYLSLIIHQNMPSKKEWCKKIQANLLLDKVKLMNFCIKELDESNLKKNKIIKKIYDRQQLLRNLRNNCSFTVNLKKRILKEEINLNEDSPCESHIIEIREQSNSLNSIIKLQASKNSYSESSIKKSKSLTVSAPKIIFQFKQINTSEQFQKIFIPTLCKINNLYHLLHSPLQSLKSHQKQLLIQNLTTLLKQKLKDIYKYQRIQQQNQRIKIQFNYLEQHLTNISSQFKEEKQKFKRKLQKMQNMHQKQAEKVQQLCLQIAKYKKQIQKLSEVNHRVVSFQKQSQLKQNVDNKNIQILVNRHGQLLKLKYLKLIKHKSHHITNLKQLNIINTAHCNKMLKKCVFQEFKINREVNLKLKCFKKILMQGKFKQFNQFLLEKYQIHKLQSYLIRQLMIKRKRKCFSKISKYLRKDYQNQNKIQCCQSKINKNIQLKIFVLLKQRLLEANQQNQNQILIQNRKRLMYKKYLNIWKRYIKQFMQQTIDLSINRQRMVKKQYLSLFILKQRKQIQYQTSYATLQQFIANFRKTNNYQKFVKTLSSTLFGRRIRLFKIIKTKQQAYLNYFISSMRDFMQKRKIYVQQEMERLQQLKKVKQTNREQKQMQLKRKMIKFKILLKITAKKIINKILIRQEKSIKLYQQKKNLSVKIVYSNLRNQYIQALKISLKINRLGKTPSVLTKIKHFYNQLSVNSNKIKRQSKNKEQKTLLKIFYKWKAYVLWNRQLKYKSRFQKLQPQIIRISELQKQVIDQRNLLLRSLSDRQLQIQEYIEKCKEYQYLLQSKQIKYQKLKNIYSYSLQQSIELNKTAKMTDNCKSDLLNRQNIYVKYLPEDKRGEAIRKNVYQQQEGKDNHSRNKKSSFLANFKNNYIERLQSTPLQISNKPNFISPFKKF